MRLKGEHKKRLAVVYEAAGNLLRKLERAKGIEPSPPTLARSSIITQTIGWIPMVAQLACNFPRHTMFFGSLNHKKSQRIFFKLRATVTIKPSLIH